MNINAIHKSGRKLISFIIPCYHSEGSVGLVIDEIRQVVSERPDFTYQIIAVNDCSPDNLLSVIRREAENDPQVLAIDLAKNGGRHNALICGCHYADGTSSAPPTGYGTFWTRSSTATPMYRSPNILTRRSPASRISAPRSTIPLPTGFSERTRT